MPEIVIIDGLLTELNGGTVSSDSGCPADVSCGDDCTCPNDVK